MMKQRAGHDEIARASFACILENVDPPDLQTSRPQVLDVSKVKIASNYVAARHHAVGQRLRNAAVAAAKLQALPARTQSHPCDVIRFQRIEQRRHERQPLPFAGRLMRQNVVRHFAWPFVVTAAMRAQTTPIPETIRHDNTEFVYRSRVVALNPGHGLHFGGRTFCMMATTRGSSFMEAKVLSDRLGRQGNSTSRAAYDFCSH